MNRLPGARVTLINPQPTAPYTGMLPGYVAGHYGRDELEIDLVRLCRSSGARLTLANATGLDLENRHVLLDRQAPVHFDVLSINVGITTEMPELPGFSAHAIAAKPLGNFAEAWIRFLSDVEAARLPATVAILGAGVGGVELAMAAAYCMGKSLGTSPRITVVERGPNPLVELAPASRRKLLRKSAELGVEFKCARTAARVEAGRLVLEDGEIVEAGLIIGAAGATPPAWLAETGLELECGFINVDECLRVSGQASVYAAGDCCHMSRSPRSKAGVYAVRSAPVLFRNLRTALAGGQPSPFRPQRRFLKLVSMGAKEAVGEKWGLAIGGAKVWGVKDWIDRRFMTQFQELPVMDSPAVTGQAAAGLQEFINEGGKLCGGCGSKVSRQALQSGLSGIARSTAGTVAQGIGDDAAVLEWGQTVQVIATDHLRAFVDDPWLFGRIAAIHALGDIWAMGARPQAALASIVLPRMSDNLLAETQREIMDAASEVFSAEGAPIVGGHTSQGAELMIGFTITGIPDDRPVLKSGANPGDRLILTRPIGTGTILAGEMAGKACGTDVETALRTMSRSSGPAARVLAGTATAMTDVTGFGLAGHLFEILEASGVAAEIDLAAVPVLPGAQGLAALGVRSTIWKSNAELRGRMSSVCDDRADLLFDPQTAGGLLAAVPANAVDHVMDELANAGETAAVIGGVMEGEPWLSVLPDSATSS